MKIIDDGHIYRLLCLDTNEQGRYDQYIMFVKRKYPNKVPVYPGTTCQEVLRVLYDRVEYLHKEKPHWVNFYIKQFIKLSIWLFEVRAARQRGYWYFHTPKFATLSEPCNICGHTDCRLNHG